MTSNIELHSKSNDQSHIEAPENSTVEETNDHSDVTRATVQLGKVQFVLVYSALMLAIFLSSLDQTILSTALKTIVQDLGHQDLIPWIGSSYLLTSASSGALYGKMADIFGRKWVFVFAILVFEIGSLICGISSSMIALIVGRAIAGVGGGGISSLVLIIISDIVSIRDRGKYQGFFGAVFGLSSVIAPLIGGGFSDSGLWRWCFFINLPFGAITVFVVIIFLKFPIIEGSIRDKIHRIDFIGALFLFATIICFITPLQLGGSVWAWDSAQVIGMFVGSIVLAAILCYVEVRVASEPIIPPSIFVNSSVPALLLIATLFMATMMSGSYYISLFYQVVYGDTATQAGLAALPIVFGLVLLSVVSGAVVSKTGNYIRFLYFGPIIIVIGIALIALLDKNSSNAVKIVYLGLFGIGCGTILQIRTLAIQYSVPRNLIAIATATAQTCSSLGGAIGIAVTGTVFNNVVENNLSGAAALQSILSKFAANGISVDETNVPGVLDLLQASALNVPNNTAAAALYNATLANATNEVIDGFTGAFKIGYICLLPYPVIMFLLAVFFVRQFDIGSGGDSVPVAE
ncbi:hypothetical protein HK100_005170 [Physocladia obscura]|uniref:Major facilitator superfamily (MFS) profile domain-containing protein n=1 Tax=Physocladia obscura TaxID=109957 RepID=A0AAD5SUG2_9FUNG|nr:hypothetical protein HK100_005170 [Physocladia obscura]